MTTRQQVDVDPAAIRDRRPTDAAQRRKQIDADVARLRRAATLERAAVKSPSRPLPARPRPSRIRRGRPILHVLMHRNAHSALALTGSRDVTARS